MKDRGPRGQEAKPIGLLFGHHVSKKVFPEERIGWQAEKRQAPDRPLGWPTENPPLPENSGKADWPCRSAPENQKEERFAWPFLLGRFLLPRLAPWPGWILPEALDKQDPHKIPDNRDNSRRSRPHTSRSRLDPLHRPKNPGGHHTANFPKPNS